MTDTGEDVPLLRRDRNAGEIDLDNRDPKLINEDVAKVHITLLPLFPITSVVSLMFAHVLLFLVCVQTFNPLVRWFIKLIKCLSQIMIRLVAI